MDSLTSQLVAVVISIILTTALPYFINKWSDKRAGVR